MNKIKTAFFQLGKEVGSPRTLRLFTVLLYLWLVLTALFLWNIKGLLWGESSVILRSARPSGLINNFVYQLVYLPGRFHLIYFTYLIAAVLSLFEFKWSFIPRFITWMSGLILYHSAVQAFNPAMSLMLLLSFYSIFVNTKSSNLARIVLTNLAGWALHIQVSLVFLFTAFHMAGSSHWLSGDAFYYLLNVDSYSLNIGHSPVGKSFALVIFTFVILLFQFSFPFFVWVKKLKSYFVIAGIIIYLTFGFLTGIWDYVTAVIICIVLFSPDNSLITSRIKRDE